MTYRSLYYELMNQKQGIDTGVHLVKLVFYAISSITGQIKVYREHLFDIGNIQFPMGGLRGDFFVFFSTFFLSYVLLPFDPLGRPTDTAGSDHSFHTCFRPSVHTYKNIAKQTQFENNDHHWSRLWGLAKGIIDDSCLVFFYFFIIIFGAPHFHFKDLVFYRHTSVFHVNQSERNSR